MSDANTQVSAAGTAGCCDLSREELTLLGRHESPPWPAWATALTARHPGQPLLDVVENLVSAALNESHALSPHERPHVRLMRLAELLGAEIILLAEQKDRTYDMTLQSPSTKQAGWQRGVLERTTNERWRILAGSRSSPFTRISVAHELAHALLYRHGSQVQLDVWEASPWSALEEAVCNYVARSLLAPIELMRLPSRDMNVAEHVFRNIAGPFMLPLEVASRRVIDVMHRLGSHLNAALLWKQYHPLDPAFLKAALSSYPEALKHLQYVMKKIRGTMPGLTFHGARSLWAALLHEWNGQEDLLSGLNQSDIEEQEKVVSWAQRELAYVRMSARHRGIIDRLLKVGPWWFRPEWVVWGLRPHKGFIPLKMGTARTESLAARMACEGHDAIQSTIEDVRIGSLAGTFHIDGFAHGDSSEGKRIILQIFRSAEPSTSD